MKKARLQPLGLDGATVNGIFPQSRNPWVKVAPKQAPEGRKHPDPIKRPGYSPSLDFHL
jgi:hypothetical protein